MAKKKKTNQVSENNSQTQKKSPEKSKKNQHVQNNPQASQKSQQPAANPKPKKIITNLPKIILKRKTHSHKKNLLSPLQILSLKKNLLSVLKKKSTP